MRAIRHLARALTAALTALAVVTVQVGQSWPARAEDDAMARAIADGKAAGNAVKPNAASLATVDAQGNVTLWPGSSQATALGVDELFHGSSASGRQSLEDLYGSNQGMVGAGIAARTGHATGDDTSPVGQAHQLMSSGAVRERPSMRNDPVWGATDSVLANMSAWQQELGSCSTSRTWNRRQRQVHVPDYRTCEKVVSGRSSQDLLHEYQVKPIIELGAGALNLASCGAGCLVLGVGRANDSYTGDCDIFTEVAHVKVLRPGLIRSVTLSQVRYEDRLQVYLQNEKVLQEPDSLFPPEVGHDCSTGGDHNDAEHVDVTRYFRAGGDIELRLRISAEHNGKGYARLEIRFDPSAVIDDPGWRPQPAIDLLGATEVGLCTVTAACTDLPAVKADGCAVVDGVTVCPSDLQAAPAASGLSPLCRHAVVTRDCGNVNEGGMECYYDANGERQCPVNEGGASNCQALEDDASCGFISSSCLLEAGAGCRVTELTYDCGDTSSVDDLSYTDATSCTGQVRCMGGECQDVVRETSTGFGEAAAALKAAEMMRADSSCVGSGDDDAGKCEVFKGKAYECRRAVGGVVDCCEQPTGVSLGNYLALAFAVAKLDAALTSTQMEGGALRGAWETLRYPFDSAWTEISSSFSSSWNSLTGATTATASGTEQQAAAAGLGQAAMQATAQWTADVFGPAAANSLFSVVTANGATVSAIGADGTLATGVVQLGGGAAIVGTVLWWAMAAYTIYTVTMLLIQIIWACTSDEFELAVKRDLKSCHKVGSYCALGGVGPCIEKRTAYCCFASPISRILQEQMRLQLDMSWGDPEDPSCEGIAVERFAEIDWSRVDLSEWLAILETNGQLPDLDHLDLESLTGAGSSLARVTGQAGTANGDPSPRSFRADAARAGGTSTGRPDAAVRAVARIEGLDTGALRDRSAEELYAAYAAGPSPPATRTLSSLGSAYYVKAEPAVVTAIDPLTRPVPAAEDDPGTPVPICAVVAWPTGVLSADAGDLPYAGTMYGIGEGGDAASGVPPFADQADLRVRTERDGKLIALGLPLRPLSVAGYLEHLQACGYRGSDVDAAPAATRSCALDKVIAEGIQLGNGGTLAFALMADDGQGKPGRLLASGRAAIRPVGDSPHDLGSYRGRRWQAATGFDNSAVVVLDQPVPVTAGQWLHVVVQQQDPAGGSSAIPAEITFQRPAQPLGSPFYGVDWSARWRDTPGEDWQRPTGMLMPLVQLRYADGRATGPVRVGQAHAEAPEISGTTKVRQRFTVDGGSRTVTGFWLRVGLRSGTGRLELSLRQGASTELASSYLEAWEVPSVTAGFEDSAVAWSFVTLDAPLTLGNGAAYELWLSTDSATSYRLGFSVPVGSLTSQDAVWLDDASRLEVSEDDAQSFQPWRYRPLGSSAAPTVAPYADLQLIFTVESLPITLSGHCDDDPDEPGDPGDPGDPGEPGEPIPACTTGRGVTLNSYGTLAGGQQAIGTTSFDTMTGVATGIWHEFVGRCNGWAPLAGTVSGSRLPLVAAALRQSPCRRVALSYPGLPTADDPPNCNKPGGLYTNNRPKYTMDQCVAGQFDGYYLSYGRQIRAYGIKNLILRLGWEWDADTNALNADGDPAKAAKYAQCYRRIALNIRAGCPECNTQFDFNSTTRINRRGDLIDIGFPGPDVVDIVSIEGYDNTGPKGDPPGRWQALKSAFDYVKAFGQRKSAYFAIPEWAVLNTELAHAPDSFNGGGDNGYHVQQVCTYAKDAGNGTYWLVYFNGSADRYPWHDLRANPNAMAAYRQYCRPIDN